MFGPIRKSELQKIFAQSLERKPPRFITLEAAGPDPSQKPKQSGSLAGQREAVVGLVVRYDDSREGATDLEFLLTLRSETLKEHAAQVSFPGGLLEPDEKKTPLAALDRELFEEVGIPLGAVAWVEGHWDVLPSLYGIAVYPYLGFLPRSRCPEPLEPAPAEVAEYAWLDVWSLFDVTRWARRPLSRAPWEWRGWKHETWGLTAAFLALFVERVGGRPVADFFAGNSKA